MRIELRTSPTTILEGDQIGTPTHETIDLAALERDLKAAIEGEVRFDAGSKGMYAHDASNYRMVPLGVVVPKSKDDAVRAVALAKKHRVPIVARGGGTGIPGQSVNVALMIDFSKYMHRVISIDAGRSLASVQPGTVLDTLRDEAKKHGLTFGPDPATHTRCTLGGMIGNNSCGIHSMMAGRTSDNIDSLEIVTYDGERFWVGPTTDEQFETLGAQPGRKGEIYRKVKEFRDKYADLIRQKFPDIPRRVSGYNLPALLPENGCNIARALVGSECTLVTVLEARCNLIPNPPARSLLVLGFPDIFAAADFVPECFNWKPVGLEAMDSEFIDDMKAKGMHPQDMELMPAGHAWLLVEFGGKDKQDSDAQAKSLMDDVGKKNNGMPMKLFDDAKHEALVWHLREEGLGATARVPGKPENHEGWEDAAVAPERLGAYLRDFSKLMEAYGYEGSLYGHFGQGCVHTRLTFDLHTAAGVEKYRHFVQEAADLVHHYDGSLSGEHGDGQARGELLERMFGDDMIQAFVEFKQIWDPDWLMNPGKLVAPYRLDENLSQGPDFSPPEVTTHFSFSDDDYSFSKASRRCVGAGACRKHGGGTMCPSYMVTMEEKHSTRGRARLLGEMIRGDQIQTGWQSKEVKDALDLCLACKGCKGECPVQVDMATYKAEFLSHYYKKHSRPISAFAFGFIHVWAKFASKLPLVANLATRAPIIGSFAKKVIGIAPKRRIPAFAPYTFREWFQQRPRTQTGGRKVILWPDTFNDHFHPMTAQAAVEVLEAAGCEVSTCMEDVCCGRPLYDYGFLTEAKQWLARILVTLREDIRAGTPIIVLEPSCAAVFRDELTNLFPHDEDASRLKAQTYLLSEFLEKECPDFHLPKLNRSALLHGHCHQKSIMGMAAEESVLSKMGVKVREVDSGCCGMAGAFGFEAGEHYDVAMKCGERVLLPEVRNTADEELVIADGFSCREQISQTTHRQALHLAQVIQLGLNGQGPVPFPETELNRAPIPPRELAKTFVVFGVAVAAIGGLAFYASRASNRRDPNIRGRAKSKR